MSYYLVALKVLASALANSYTYNTISQNEAVLIAE